MPDAGGTDVATATVTHAAVAPGPPTYGPCVPWATIEDTYECGCAGVSTSEALLTTNLTISSELLWAKSGRQFSGTCSETVWPCCTSDLCVGTYRPDIVLGRWFNFAPGRQCLPWDCGALIPTIDLGVYPVTSIEAVTIGGEVLSPGSYRLDGWRYLVRTDGYVWPTIQNLLAADGSPDTWSIALGHGQPPPRSGVHAAAELGCELTKHCSGDTKCALPLRVTAVSRQGVTYNIADVMDILDRGGTGLYFVDLFLDTINPHKLDRPPRIVSPDRRDGVRRLGSG